MSLLWVQLGWNKFVGLSVVCRAHLENSSLSFLAVAIMRGKEEMDKERQTKVYD